MLIINPGTEKRTTATIENAEAVATEICKDLSLSRDALVRVPERDNDGWFAFRIVGKDGPFDVDIPGDDPDQVCAGRPFVSRRLYVDGSSWLYGYALNRIEERI